MSAAPPGPLIFLVAGEPSGDVLGGRLMAALKAQSEVEPRFAGVGGERMIAEGLESLFPMAELSVMGYLEVVPKIPRLLARVRETARAARRLRPAVVVTIDSPDFTFRVARRLAGAGIPVVHYVAPQVWAHRPGRAAKVAKFIDHLLAVLPFEPPYFEAVGLPCSYVGHAIVEEGAELGDGPAFRARHHIPGGAPVVCALPGSRHGEVSRHLPVFGETLGLLATRFPGLRAAVPAVAVTAGEVRAGAAAWPVETRVVGGGEKYDAIAAADVALAASGTIALELAIARVPMVITYKANPLTVWLARRMIRVDYVCLVNLVLGRPAVPELLQEMCRPEPLAEAVELLLRDQDARQQQIGEACRAVKQLGLGGQPPSERAAEVVLEVMNRGIRAR